MGKSVRWFTMAFNSGKTPLGWHETGRWARSAFLDVAHCLKALTHPLSIFGNHASMSIGESVYM